MNTTPPTRLSLDKIPLWRLLVTLHDVERTFGPDCETAQALAHVISERLRVEPDDPLCQTTLGGPDHVV